MADLSLSLTLEGGGGPAAVPRGQSRTLTLRATNGPGGAGVAATGPAITIRSPDGTDTVLSGSELTAGATGAWTAVVEFGVAGTWVARGTCDGPTAGATLDLVIAVHGSATDAPIPGPLSPVLQDAQQSAEEAAQSAEDAAEAAASVAAAMAEIATLSAGLADATTLIAAQQAMIEELDARVTALEEASPAPSLLGGTLPFILA
jgi:hypothetical protein